MTNSAHFSNIAPVIHGIAKPYPSWTVGYAAVIQKLGLPILLLS